MNIKFPRVDASKIFGEKYRFPKENIKIHAMKWPNSVNEYEYFRRKFSNPNICIPSRIILL